MKIGVFHSGVGGLSVVNKIKEELPEHQVIFINDVENMPYGDKTKEQLLHLVVPKLNVLTDSGCEVIVIACNTVTTNIVNKLREIIVVPIIAVEPMINMGTKNIKQHKDGWTITTADGKPSAHFEHDVAIIDGKPELLSTFAYVYEALGIVSNEEQGLRQKPLVL